jgi:Domain of unknown function (DUF4347)
VHRVQNPGTGRWSSQDPLRFAAGDVNLYRYAGNSSTNLADAEGLEIAIGFPKDGTTKVANWWNSWWVPNLPINPSNPDWPAYIQWLTTVRGNIGRVTISGHGGPGHVGPITSQNLNDPNSGPYKFLQALGKRHATTIIIKSCSVANGKTGRDFLVQIAKLTGAKVVGYTDVYAFTPHGDELTALPDGTITVTGHYGPYKGSPVQKYVGKVAK